MEKAQKGVSGVVLMHERGGLWIDADQLSEELQVTRNETQRYVKDKNGKRGNGRGSDEPMILLYQTNEKGAE